MKKFITLLLIFSIISLSGNLYAKERRGADLVIQKIDGQQVKGELITVKKDSLLLKDAGSGADVSVDVSDIETITIVKKSKALLGFLIGGVVAGVTAQLTMSEETKMEGEPTFVTLGYGLLGALLGGTVGMVAGKDKTIQFEGESDSEINKTLEDLRKKARVPDFQ